MAPYVALLHSITIGGGRRLVMSEWRAMMEAAGFKCPRTLIATGNALFESEPATIRQLEKRLEIAFEQSFGRHVDTIVKSAAYWRKLTAGNPFVEEAERDGTQVAVRIMRKPLDHSAVVALMPYASRGERLEVANGALWISFEGEPARPRLPAALTNRRFGVGTFRNWNTVRRLNEMIPN